MMSFDDVVGGLIDQEKPKGAMDMTKDAESIKSKAWGLVEEAMKLLDDEGMDAEKEITDYMAGMDSEEKPGDAAPDMSDDGEEDAPAEGAPKKELIIAMLKKKKAARE